MWPLKAKCGRRFGIFVGRLCVVSLFVGKQKSMRCNCLLGGGWCSVCVLPCLHIYSRIIYKCTIRIIFVPVMNNNFRERKVMHS